MCTLFSIAHVLSIYFRGCLVFLFGRLEVVLEFLRMGDDSSIAKLTLSHSFRLVWKQLFCRDLFHHSIIYSMLIKSKTATVNKNGGLYSNGRALPLAEKIRIAQVYENLCSRTAGGRVSHVLEDPLHPAAL